MSDSYDVKRADLLRTRPDLSHNMHRSRGESQASAACVVITLPPKRSSVPPFLPLLSGAPVKIVESVGAFHSFVALPRSAMAAVAVAVVFGSQRIALRPT